MVRVERGTGPQGGLVRLVMDRPDQRNAVSAEMLSELDARLGEFAVDAEARVIVLSGEGPDFCAGADIAELTQARRGVGIPGFEYGRALEDLLSAIQAHPLPIIAQVHGAALGAGCQLVVACDLAVAENEARLGIPSARLGIVLNYENIERLVLATGPKRAAEILYAGTVISGAEAVSWGLVNRAVPLLDLARAAEALAVRIAGGAPLSVRGSKRGIAGVLRQMRLDRFADGQRVADFEMMAAEAFASEDLGEGIQAFRDRREPRFRGT